MKVELKTWAGLGLATALAGASLTGCSGASKSDRGRPKAVEASQAGDFGEGGESGEGGVVVSDAAVDPIAYRSALAIAEAHAIAAKDAFAAGETMAAAEMFAHPVSEVLLDMDPVFAAQNVEDFKPLFLEASTGAVEKESTEQIDAHFDAIATALRGAAKKAPGDGASEAAIASGVISDMIERANAMYREAADSDRYEPYLDGYGYYKAAQAEFAASQREIEADNAKLHANIVAALDLLASAYPSVERPAQLDANQGKLSAAGSRVLLSL